MPKRTSKSGSELFIVDSSDAEWKVLRYLHDWCQFSKAIDIATGYFEIGGMLGLEDQWQKGVANTRATARPRAAPTSPPTTAPTGAKSKPFSKPATPSRKTC